jgi:hypothetical protein
MPNNEEEKGMKIETYMEDFKTFIDRETDRDPDDYDELAYQVLELISLNDAFVSMLMQMQQQQTKQQQEQQGKPDDFYVPEKSTSDNNIVTPDFNG